MSGFARAVLKLRDLYAPNVIARLPHQRLGHRHGHRPVQPARRDCGRACVRAANFYISLAADFDIAFAEFSDRDAAFKQYVYGDGGQSWFDAEDFRRSARFFGGFSSPPARES